MRVLSSSVNVAKHPTTGEVPSPPKFILSSKYVRIDDQDIGCIKHSVWLEGGPHPDFQKLFTVGSGQPLSDHKRLEEVLRRGASLQLVVTPPPWRCLSIYSGWGRSVVPTCAEDERVPYFDKVSGPSHGRYVMTPVEYLGDIIVESHLRGKHVASQVQQHFLLDIDCPCLTLCVATDKSLGCPGKSLLGPGLDLTRLQPKETFEGASIGLQASRHCTRRTPCWAWRV